MDPTHCRRSALPHGFRMIPHPATRTWRHTLTCRQRRHGRPCLRRLQCPALLIHAQASRLEEEETEGVDRREEARRRGNERESRPRVYVQIRTPKERKKKLLLTLSMTRQPALCWLAEKKLRTSDPLRKDTQREAAKENRGRHHDSSFSVRKPDTREKRKRPKKGGRLCRRETEVEDLFSLEIHTDQ